MLSASPEILQYARYIFAVKILLTHQGNIIFGFLECNYQTTGEQKRKRYLLLAPKTKDLSENMCALPGPEQKSCTPYAR